MYRNSTTLDRNLISLRLEERGAADTHGHYRDARFHSQGKDAFLEREKLTI
jgi:hypothetical protein